MNNRRVLISGAGIAGPTVAYWLHHYGFEPALIERAPAFREGGYIVDFWGTGFDVAEKMGILPWLRTDGYKIDEIRYVNRRGERVGGFNAKVFGTVLEGRYLSILRSDLSRRVFQLLDDRVETIFGDSIVGIDSSNDGVNVIFSRGASRMFDLVIGADGLHSGVRRLAFGPETAFEKYLGYYAASFSAEGYPQRDSDFYVSYSAPGRSVSRYSLRENRTGFFFVFAAKSGLPVGPHNIEAQKDTLHQVFGRDQWECPAILRALDAAPDLYFDSVSQIRMDGWSRGRVALIGDACYCPSLLAGQGSALAIAGAYLLAGELKKARGDYASAFGSYENLFRPLIERKQRAAEGFASSFAPKTSFGIFARNKVTRLMAISPLARYFMGGLLFDRLSLPDY